MKNDAITEKDPLIGTTIEGRYCIKECLGEGGMGSVYVAEHLKLHKDVALKIIRAEFAQHEAAAERFAREAMVTSRFQHPNVVSAIDFGELPSGGAFLAMELVRGRSIAKILETEGCLPWGRACALAAQIADALASAKEHGIVHRDIKPDNILVATKPDGTEVVKVLDFGIARFDRDSMVPPSAGRRQRMTLQGTILGTPGYMSPEQLVGDVADHRADLYSLGVVLWECIVGRPLWNGEDLQRLMKSQLSEVPPSVRDAAEDLTVPDELVGLLASLLKRRPQERPQNAAEVRDLLHLLVSVQRGSGLLLLPDTPLAERLAAMADAVKYAEEKSSVGLNPTVQLELMDRDEQLAAAGATSTPMTAERTASRATPPRPPPPVRKPPPRKSRVGFLLFLLSVVAMGALVYSGQLEVRVKPKGDLNTIATAIAPKLVEEEPEPKVEEPEAAPPDPPRAVDGSPFSSTGLPESLDPQLDAVVKAESRGDRVAAAETLLSHIPMEEVPGYVRIIAHLQLAANCEKKREQLTLLTETPDSRALPALVMVSQRAKEGCGKPKRDCLACMRADLDGFIAQLEEAVTTATAEAAAAKANNGESPSPQAPEAEPAPEAAP